MGAEPTEAKWLGAQARGQSYTNGDQAGRRISHYHHHDVDLPSSEKVIDNMRLLYVTQNGYTLPTRCTPSPDMLTSNAKYALAYNLLPGSE